MPPVSGAPAAPPAPDPGLYVAGLWAYPVKSLGGVPLAAARVGPLGVVGDRRWMLVDAAGRFLSQREAGAMARLRVTLAGDPCGDAVPPVTVHAPDGRSIALAPPPADAPRRRVVVWGDVVEAATHDAATDRWFTEALARPCALVYLPGDAGRRVDPDHADADDRTAFTDGFPVLVATRASLDDLNARLAARGEPAVAIERFRPSVLVGGTARPYAEDGWGALRAGEVALRLAKPCGRCVVTTLDPATGASTGVEPLRTLSEYRRVNGKVWFAQNALVRAGGVVRVGDAVRVTAAAPPAGAGSARAH